MTEEVSSPESQMRLSSREFKAMNNSFRRWFQKKFEFQYFLAMLRSQHVDLEGKRILDAGCGSGYSSFLLSSAFHPSVLSAFDLMPEQIELAKKNFPDIAFRVGNLLEIQESDGSYDAAFVFGVIHHIPEWRGALKELARCLAEGGYLLIEEPHYRFEFPELEAGIEAAGFDILERKKFVFGYFRTYLTQKSV
jgi:ubiquinone/menaquinone biosynthesis C-methylase UbiE